MTKKNIFLTIAIPSLNRIESLKLVINSILDQTFLDYEVLIVDDCSDEKIKEYIFSLKSSRIRFIGHNKRQGFKKVIEKSLLEAKGKYVMTLGNDDILCDKDTLKHIYQKLNKKDIGLAKLGLIYYYKSPNMPCFSTQLDLKDRYIKNTDYPALFAAIDAYGLTHIAGTIYLRKLINKESFLDNQLLPFFKTVIDCGTKKGFVFIAKEYIATGMSTSYLSLFSQKTSNKELWFNVMYTIYSKYINKNQAKDMIVQKIKEQIPFFIAIKSYVGVKEIRMLIHEYINFDSSFRYNIDMYLSFFISIIFPKGIFLLIRDLRYKVASKRFHPPKKYIQL